MDAKQKGEQEIFYGAIAIGSSVERAAFVRSACGDDAELLRRVEGLLRVHYEDGSFLKSSAAGSAITAAISPLMEGPGTKIGRYKLLELIGEGGFGNVYMAEQESPFRRRVALKIIKLGMDTKQVIARFEAERQALAMMDHPNIAKVFDAGTTDTGRPYFVMELVKGISITQYCDEHRLTPRQRLELFVQVCQAVQHAHQKGIIHRDIKPSNVMLAEYDDRIVPKIIDFGVAKAIEQRLSQRTMFTQFAQVVGTVDYMSPEQAKLNQLDIDTRSDIYSLGVLLYELLTGGTPFDKQRLRAAAFDELLRIIREEEPPRPSTRLGSSGSLAAIAANRQTEARKLSTLVEGELDWIVMKALEKNRDRRYETANALAADLEHYLADEPVAACPPSAAYRLRKFARRNRPMLTTAAIVGVILLLASVISTRQAIRATRASQAEATARFQAEQAAAEARHRADEAMAARGEAERATADAQAVSDFLLKDLLGSAEPARTLGREVTVKEVLANAEKAIDTAFKDQPLREAAVRHTIGSTYYALAQHGAAVLQIRRALSLRTQWLGLEDPATLASMNNLANLLRATGNLEEARKLYEQAAAAAEHIQGAEHPMTLSIAGNLVAVLRELGKEDEAVALNRKTLNIQTRVLGPEHPETLRLLANEGLGLWKLGNNEDAYEIFARILPAQKRLLGPEHPETLKTMGHLGYSLRTLGRLNEAREVFEEMTDVQRRVLGPEHPQALYWAYYMAATLQAAGEEEKACELYAETLTIQKRVLGYEHPDTVRTLTSLVLGLIDAGKMNKVHELWMEFLPQLHSAAAEHPESEPLQARVALFEKDVWLRYGAIGLWDLAAIPAQHNAALQRVTNRTTDADLAVMLAAVGEEDTWRQYCQCLLPRPAEGLSAQQLRTMLLFDPPAIDADELAAMAEEVLLDDPGNHYFQFCLALAQYRAKQYAQALRTIESNPLNTAWNSISGLGNKMGCAFLKAMAAGGEGRMQDALAQMQRAEALYQKTCQAQLDGTEPELGEPFRSWFWDMATTQVLRREAWQKIQAQAPPADPWWRLVQARGSGWIGESERARKELADALTADPNNAAIRLTGARLLRQWGQIARAEDECSRAIQLRPEDPRGWIERAICRTRLGEHEKGDADRAHAAMLKPVRDTDIDLAEARCTIGQLYWDGGRRADAYRLLQEVLSELHEIAAEHPDDKPLQRRVARCTREICRNSPAVAIAALEQCDGWGLLFDGQSLDGWTVGTGENFGGRLRVADGAIVLDRDNRYTGIVPTRPVPLINYELAYEVWPEGPGEFASLIFPCGQRCARWYVDEQSTHFGAGNNNLVSLTRREVTLAAKLWHEFRVQVTPE